MRGLTLQNCIQRVAGLLNFNCLKNSHEKNKDNFFFKEDPCG